MFREQLTRAWRRESNMERCKCSGLMSSVKFYLIYCIVSSWLLVAFFILRVMRNLPLLKHAIPWVMDIISATDLQKDTYWESVFTWPMYTTVRDVILLEIQKETRQGYQAPNCQLVSSSGKSSFRLLDMAKGTRPLVVNFGSCTCPIFRKKLGEFTQMAKRFIDIADFLVVYIEEAHPSDGWAFERNVIIPRHQTQEDRCCAARLLQQHVPLPCPLLVDTMKDEAKSAYGAYPIRLCIIQDEKVIYAGGMGPTLYRPVDVRKYLEDLKDALFKLSKKSSVMNPLRTAECRRSSFRAG